MSAASGNGWFAIAGRDVAEGSARACLAARQQAEAVALRFLDIVVRRLPLFSNKVA
jgi:hypothetical protein